ncbi:sulfotransferase family 2 domain-containing protein [Desulfobulbus rhabdoformis]|uniref:sulfotransferase family 2 domain-containing protein n=1 Tax=Desulfobulbus rhabdoformis TaxID=34032 RepID=UPI001964F3C6|nr:sulfotransferase family 2 domain-containing protein [Desulfobulbus rhabdoformis]MBM9614406.1 sulfotransferase family 2 domain-containing protein [Desulfobulbus rhabdoformis]
MKPKQFAKKIIKNAFACGKAIVEESKYRRLTQNYDIQGYKRVYLVHIRKTGGTSLNKMFLSLSGEDPNHLYAKLAQSFDHRLLANGLIYVGWNVKYIDKGTYFYAFSHTPYHKLSLPDKTFTVSCFRDPVKRLISHYNMLMDFSVNKIAHPCMATEGKWLGSDFDAFLSKIPREQLLNQLYMFSSNFDINEAVSNVRKLSHFFFSDNFNKGVDELNNKTGLSLGAMHIRKARYQVQVSDDSLAALREMVHDEYRFLDKIRESQNG